MLCKLVGGLGHVQVSGLLLLVGLWVVETLGVLAKSSLVGRLGSEMLLRWRGSDHSLVWLALSLQRSLFIDSTGWSSNVVLLLLNLLDGLGMCKLV